MRKIFSSYMSTPTSVFFCFPFFISFFFPYSALSFHCLAFSILSQSLLIFFLLLGFIKLPRPGQSKEKYAFHRRRSCRGQHHGSHCRSWGKGCKFDLELFLSLNLTNLPSIKINKKIWNVKQKEKGDVKIPMLETRFCLTFGLSWEASSGRIKHKVSSLEGNHRCGFSAVSQQSSCCMSVSSSSPSQQRL